MLRMSEALSTCVWFSPALVEKRGGCLSGEKAGEQMTYPEIFLRVQGLQAGRVCPPNRLAQMMAGTKSSCGTWDVWDQVRVLREDIGSSLIRFSPQLAYSAGKRACSSGAIRRQSLRELLLAPLWSILRISRQNQSAAGKNQTAHSKTK